MTIASSLCTIQLLILSVSFFYFHTQSRASTSPIPSIQLPHSHAPHTTTVTDHGATGDGTTYDTNAIQYAINSISSSSGYGRVIFPPGTYLTATIHLKSGVVLDLHPNATILGGTRIEDYPPEQERWYVVLAEDVDGVGITGGGEINGQGLKFVRRFDERKNVMVSWNETGACLGDECRPRLVGFLRCKGARIWDVRLTEPAYWWCVPSPLSLSFNHTFYKYLIIY